MHRLKALAKSVTVPTPTTSSDSFAPALRERSPTQAEAAAKKNAVDDVDDVIVIDAGVPAVEIPVLQFPLWLAFAAGAGEQVDDLPPY